MSADQSVRNRIRKVILMVAVLAVGSAASAQTLATGTSESPAPRRILLVAGETARVDAVGHHDYLAGVQCLAVLLKKTSGVEAVQVRNGWPAEDSTFDGVHCIVFYTDGGGKQAFLASPERVARMQALVDAGTGLVMIHQAVDFPDEFAEQAKSWIGGIYQHGKSGRGHWPSSHVDFPVHEITRGVTPWQVKDGWLNGLQFVDEMTGITPLVWSGKDNVESRAGLHQDIVAWAYERPRGGRSFSFTGLDAHSAWSLPGMRQLVVNGVLWSAGVAVPEKGADCGIEEAELNAMLTPRQPKGRNSK